jgi:hypothetical protein
MRYRLELRLTAADVGARVVLRWRRPAEGGEEVADVLGILEAADRTSFTVRKASGEVVVIPRERALGGKTVPPAPAARPRSRRQLSKVTRRWFPRPCPACGAGPSHLPRGGADRRRSAAPHWVMPPSVR